MGVIFFKSHKVFLSFRFLLFFSILSLSFNASFLIAGSLKESVGGFEDMMYSRGLEGAFPLSTGDFFDFGDLRWVVEFVNDSKGIVRWRSATGEVKETYNDFFLPPVFWTDSQGVSGIRTVVGRSGKLFPLAVGKSITFRTLVNVKKNDSSWEENWTCKVTQEKVVSSFVGPLRSFDVECHQSFGEDSYILFTYSPQISHYVQVKVLDSQRKTLMQRVLHSYHTHYIDKAFSHYGQRKNWVPKNESVQVLAEESSSLSSVSKNVPVSPLDSIQSQSVEDFSVVLKKPKKESFPSEQPPIKENSATVSKQKQESIPSQIIPQQPPIKEGSAAVSKQKQESIPSQVIPQQPPIKEDSATVSKQKQKSIPSQIIPQQPPIKEGSSAVSKQKQESIPSQVIPQQPPVKEGSAAVSKQKQESIPSQVIPQQPPVKEGSATVSKQKKENIPSQVIPGQPPVENSLPQESSSPVQANKLNHHNSLSDFVSSQLKSHTTQDHHSGDDPSKKITSSPSSTVFVHLESFTQKNGIKRYEDNIRVSLKASLNGQDPVFSTHTFTGADNKLYYRVGIILPSKEEARAFCLQRSKNKNSSYCKIIVE